MAAASSGGAGDVGSLHDQFFDASLNRNAGTRHLTGKRTGDSEVKRSAARLLDEYLVAAARTGDQRAFSMLAERWSGKLLAHAWRLTADREAARDSAQGAWLEIVRGLPALKDERAFPAWAFRIVSCRCARHVGDEIQRRNLAVSLAEEPTPTTAQTDTSLEAERLRSAIAALPPDQRSAVYLFYLEEMTVAEVAVALAIPVGTVKTRLMHARRKLRAALEGDE